MRKRTLTPVAVLALALLAATACTSNDNGGRSEEHTSELQSPC